MLPRIAHAKGCRQFAFSLSPCSQGLSHITLACDVICIESSGAGACNATTPKQNVRSASFPSCQVPILSIISTKQILLHSFLNFVQPSLQPFYLLSIVSKYVLSIHVSSSNYTLVSLNKKGLPILCLFAIIPVVVIKWLAPILIMTSQILNFSVLYFYHSVHVDFSLLLKFTTLIHPNAWYFT